MIRYTEVRFVHGACKPTLDFDTFNTIRTDGKGYVFGEPIDRLYEYEKTGMEPDYILDLKDEIKRLERELKELNDKYIGLLKKRMKLSETNSDMSERIGRLESENNKLKKERYELETENGKLKIQLAMRIAECNDHDDLKRELDIAKDANNILKEKAALNHKEEVAFYQKQYVDVKKQLDDALEKLDEKNAKSKHDDETMSSMVEDIKELRKENFDFRMNKKKLEHEIKTLDSILNSKHEEVVETRNMLNGLKEENENLKKRIDDLMSDASSEFINNCIYETIRRGDSRARIYFENHHVSFTFSPISDKE